MRQRAAGARRAWLGRGVGAVCLAIGLIAAGAAPAPAAGQHVVWQASAAVVGLGPPEEPTPDPAPPDEDSTPTPDEPTPPDEPESPAPTDPQDGTPPAGEDSGSASPTQSPTPTATSAAPVPTAPSPTETMSPSSVPTTTAPARPEPRPAAAQRSGIPVPTVIAAAVVLILVTGLVILMLRRWSARPAPASPPTSGMPALPAPMAVPSPSLGAFLIALGGALIDSGEAVNDVTRRLRTVAAVNGDPRADVVVLSSALFVTAGGSGETVHTAIGAAGTDALRLDQVDALHRAVRAAEEGTLSPRAGLRELERIRTMRPPFAPAVRVLGHALLTVGLAAILQGGWLDMLLAAGLGAGVGLLHVSSSTASSRVQSFLPPLAAFGVSVAVLLVGRVDARVGEAALIAPLVTFLPGALLTTAALELATGHMIAGAGRLAAGSMRLFLLALGIVGATQLVGVPWGLLDSPGSQAPPGWLPWAGVAVFGAGAVVYFCGRLSALGWMLVVLYAAHAGQVVGAFFLGGVLSAFVGAAVMTPIARVVSRAPAGPPSSVSVLPAFWLLVPGALGLVGVTQYVADVTTGGLDTLITTAATMVAVALGVLLGTPSTKGDLPAGARARQLPPAVGDPLGAQAAPHVVEEP